MTVSAVTEAVITEMSCKYNDAADGYKNDADSSTSSGTGIKRALSADGLPR